jgi:hypothetical protein
LQSISHILFFSPLHPFFFYCHHHPLLFFLVMKLHTSIIHTHTHLIPFPFSQNLKGLLHPSFFFRAYIQHTTHHPISTTQNSQTLFPKSETKNSLASPYFFYTTRQIRHKHTYSKKIPKVLLKVEQNQEWKKFKKKKKFSLRVFLLSAHMHTFFFAQF